MHRLFYDCEIIKCIPSYSEENNPKYQYCKGWDDFENMGISVIGVYANWLENYFYFQGHQLEEFEKLVCDADEIIGFNSISFDDNLIKANGLEIKTTYDLLCEVRIAAGMPPHFVKGITRGGYSLGALAESNLDMGKTGTGELAPMLWQNGQFEDVIDYCINDVKILVELYNKRRSLIDPTDGTVLVLKE